MTDGPLLSQREWKVREDQPFTVAWWQRFHLEDWRVTGFNHLSSHVKKIWLLPRMLEYLRNSAKIKYIKRLVMMCFLYDTTLQRKQILSGMSCSKFCVAFISIRKYMNGLNSSTGIYSDGICH